MSMAYNIYLKKHIGAVQHCVMWFLNNIAPETMDEIFPNLDPSTLFMTVRLHDVSKYDIEEYEAYDQYFYQNGKNSREGKSIFDFAFLHHVRNNPHHWQYWVLIDDGGPDMLDDHQVRALDMPDKYILEMLGDWWSFSYNAYLEAISIDEDADFSTENPVNYSEAYDNMYKIFDWYEEHKNSIIFSTETRNKVERFLDVLRHVLDTNRVLHVV